VNVELDVKEAQVTVTVEAGSGPYPCPECQEPTPGYDRKHRWWRHLDTCQFTTWIQADLPRVNCPTHGVKLITVPLAEPGSQFTAWFERLAIDVLRECSVKGTAGLLRITWNEAWGIKARAVARGLSRRTKTIMPHVGVDEKAIAKRHRYLTVVVQGNLKTRRHRSGKPAGFCHWCCSPAIRFPAAPRRIFQTGLASAPFLGPEEGISFISPVF
jgi:transposase